MPAWRGATLTRSDASRQRRGAVSHALVTVARGEVPALDATIRANPAELIDAVRFHRLAPLAHVLLREAAPSVAESLAHDRDRALGLHLHITTLVGHLGDLLRDVPWVVFKGPVLSEIAHPVAGLRSYTDLDVLVDPPHLRETCVRLLAAGWTIADYDDMLRNPLVPGEMHWRSPSGALVDLHWAMINMADRRRQFSVPTTELLARRVPVRLGFSSAWTLEPADALVHVCLHAALTGANKLLYLVDAQRMAARVTDWSEVGRRARAWRAAPHVALVLHRAQHTLGGRLPPRIDRLLGTSPALRVVFDVVDRVAPVDRARQDPGLARLVARAVQPAALSTLLAVSKSVGRHVLGPDRSAPAVRIQADHDALEEYLTRVEAAARATRG